MVSAKQLVRRDLKLSYLVAPLRAVVPIIGYLAVYPLILSHYSVTVLGLWSLLAIVPMAFSSIDFGFSLILTREAGSRNSEELGNVYRNYRAARKFFFMVGPIVLLIAFLFSLSIESQAHDYHKFGIETAMIVMTLAVILQRLAALDLAVLNGFGDNYFVHLVAGCTPVLFFGMGLSGILVGFPLEGLSMGFLASILSGWLAYRWRLAIKHDDWVKIRLEKRSPTRLHEVFSLMKDGVYLYLASLGMVLRDPVLRYTIGFLLGLEAVAVFEVAMRVGRTGRDIVSSGFSTLYSSFSILIRGRERDEMEIITKRAMLLLCVTGGGLLGGIFIVAPVLLEIWLGNIGETMVTPTRIVCAWATLTLFNTPFWYQLMAGGAEKHAARAIWLHSISVLALLPLGLWITLTLNEILLFWLAGSIATQIYLYIQAERQFHLVIATFRTPHIAIAISALVFTVAALITLTDIYALSWLLSITLFVLVMLVISLYNKDNLMFWIRSTPDQAKSYESPVRSH